MKNENTYKKITVTLTPAELELIQSGLTRSANENYDRVNEIEKDLPNLAPELTGLYTEELDAINALNFKLGTESDVARRIREMNEKFAANRGPYRHPAALQS